MLVPCRCNLKKIQRAGERALPASQANSGFAITICGLGQVTKTFSASDSMSIKGELWYSFYQGFLR